MESYLRAMKAHNIEPNFWISKEYFRVAGFKEIIASPGSSDQLIGIISEDTAQFIFPPISLLHGCGRIPICPSTGIWSDFRDTKYKEADATFLDLEYIYDPKNFLVMSGGDWAVFRKNVRKWPRTNDYVYVNPDDWPQEFFEEAIQKLLIKWLEQHEEVEIHDPEALLHYVQRGENRKVLFQVDEKKVMGINCWDSNYKYINFRFSICDRTEPFLNEFMRYLFYIDPDILKTQMLVNDGGVLGSEHIQRFKDKMNPVRVRKVHSWEMRRKNGNKPK